MKLGNFKERKIKTIIVISSIIFIFLLILIISITYSIYNRDSNKEISNLTNIESNLLEWVSVDYYMNNDFELLNDRRQDLIDEIEEVSSKSTIDNNDVDNIQEEYDQLKNDTKDLIENYENNALDKLNILNEQEIETCSGLYEKLLDDTIKDLQNTDDNLYERYDDLDFIIRKYNILKDDTISYKEINQKYNFNNEVYKFHYIYFSTTSMSLDDRFEEVCIRRNNSANYFSLENSEQEKATSLSGFDLFEFNIKSADDIEILFKTEESYASGLSQVFTKVEIKLDEDGGEIVSLNSTDSMLRVYEPNLFVLKEDFGYYFIFLYDRTRGNIVDKTTTIYKYDNNLKLLNSVSKSLIPPDDYARETGDEYMAEDYVIYNNNTFGYYLKYTFYNDAHITYKHYTLDENLNVLLEEDTTEAIYNANESSDIVNSKLYMEPITPDSQNVKEI